MRSSRILAVALASLILGGSLFAVAGCASRTVVVTDANGDVVYVGSAPPAPKHEAKPPKPSPSAIWVSGHWKWNGHRYVWVPGHWHTRPGGKSWVSGHWVKKPRGWVWVPGHWR